MSINYFNYFVGCCSGYMAPEYLMYGTISTKFDVYSYGVVILELVSGKKNAGNKNDQELESLVDKVRIYNFYIS